MNPKEIIEYIDSKLKGNVVPLDVERDAIQLIEEYAQSYHESKVKNLSSNTVLADRLPNAEDVKRWYQLLVGKSEDAMQKDIEATLR